MARQTVLLSPNGMDRYTFDSPPSGVLVATIDGVHEFESRNGAWHPVRHTLHGLHVGSLMREPLNGAVFAGIHGAGLYRSLDGGQSWDLRDRGLRQPHVFSLAYDQRGDAVTLYAGTEPAHLYRSTDGGESWRELTALRDVPGHERWNFPPPPHLAHVKHIAVAPQDAKTLFVCVEQGALLRSRDGGESFEEILFEDALCKLNKDTHRVVFNPNSARELYLDGGDGIFRSADGGDTWVRVATTEMRVAYPDHLYLPGDGSIIVAGGGTAPNLWRQFGDAQSTFVRSLDHGRTWEQWGGGLPQSLRGNIEAVALASWPNGYGFFAGTTDGELFVSLDKGQSWCLAASNLPAISKCMHHLNLKRGREAVAAAS